MGRPTIVWFTTSYCRPCQIGARVVARLDRELGGKAFNVLVLFVDPGEGAGALRDWRRQFGADGWVVSLDTNLARAVSLQALDTKFLLDPKGVIKNIDLNIADNRYVGLVRSVVGA
jgi:thiol-disulfide isomerase/thioredoxin